MYISSRAFQRIFCCKIWLRYRRERAAQSLFDFNTLYNYPAQRFHFHIGTTPPAGFEGARAPTAPVPSRRPALESSYVGSNSTSNYLTLKGSFSAVPKPNCASKYSLESFRRDLQNALLKGFAPFSKLTFFFEVAENFANVVPMFAKFVKFC